MAKKKTLGTALAVGVTIGLLLLVVARDYYRVVVMRVPRKQPSIFPATHPKVRSMDGVVTMRTVPMLTDVLVISDNLKPKTEPSKRAMDSGVPTGIVVGPTPVMFICSVR